MSPTKFGLLKPNESQRPRIGALIGQPGKRRKGLISGDGQSESDLIGPSAQENLGDSAAPEVDQESTT